MHLATQFNMPVAHAMVRSKRDIFQISEAHKILFYGLNHHHMKRHTESTETNQSNQVDRAVGYILGTFE